MKLLVVRHAQAEDRAEFARHCRDDAQRPLTARGQKRMAVASIGLRRLVKKLDELGSSPLTRALQTAEILGQTYKSDVPVVAELSPSKPVSSVLRWLKRHDAESTIALVGHEPQLGLLISWLMSGLDEPMLELKKGAAALLEFPGDIGAGKARLLWMLTQRQLRVMGA